MVRKRGRDQREGPGGKSNGKEEEKGDGGKRKG